MDPHINVAGYFVLLNPNLGYQLGLTRARCLAGLSPCDLL